MDSVDRSAVTPSKSRIARTLAKVLHIRAVTGAAASVDKNQKSKSREKLQHVKWNNSNSFDEDEEKQRNKAAMEAFIAKLFASLSSIKAWYAQLQFAHTPYDADGIQSADQMVVLELQMMSELKQSFLKNQIDESSPEDTQLMAEIQEQKSLLKTYEIMVKKLDSELKLKDSEITFLKEKLNEVNRENKMLDKRLNSSGQLSGLDNLHITGLSSTHFITVLGQTVKYIRSFVRLMIGEMESSGWDIDAAAMSIEPGVAYINATHKCYAFESFVCKVMFEGFHHQASFSLTKDAVPDPNQRRPMFFNQFMELKSFKLKDYLAWKPESVFAKFCQTKYLQLLHPKMELSLFGNLNQRNLVKSGEFPDTAFFASFAETAKRVWLLHCLAFSFNQEASIFHVEKGSRFSEVYMECLNAEAAVLESLEIGPRVACSVFPGFKIGKTVIQCQVLLKS